MHTAEKEFGVGSEHKGMGFLTQLKNKYSWLQQQSYILTHPASAFLKWICFFIEPLKIFEIHTLKISQQLKLAK